MVFATDTRCFKYDRDYLCVNKSQFVPVIFEPPCIKAAEARNIHLANSAFYAIWINQQIWYIRWEIILLGNLFCDTLTLVVDTHTH
jgi:hypothetical protein